MAGGGDYTRRRIIYQDASTTADFAAAAGDTTIITGKANYTLYIQRVIVTIKTSAAQTLTFQDSAVTPIYVAKIPASPGADTRWDFDFGPEGKALSTAKNFVVAMTAGNAGHWEILAYLKPDSVATA